MSDRQTPARPIQLFHTLISKAALMRNQSRSGGAPMHTSAAGIHRRNPAGRPARRACESCREDREGSARGAFVAMGRDRRVMAGPVPASWANRPRRDHSGAWALSARHILIHLIRFRAMPEDVAVSAHGDLTRARGPRRTRADDIYVDVPQRPLPPTRAMATERRPANQPRI